MADPVLGLTVQLESLSLQPRKPPVKDQTVFDLPRLPPELLGIIFSFVPEDQALRLMFWESKTIRQKCSSVFARLRPSCLNAIVNRLLNLTSDRKLECVLDKLQGELFTNVPLQLRVQSACENLTVRLARIGAKFPLIVSLSLIDYPQMEEGALTRFRFPQSVKELYLNLITSAKDKLCYLDDKEMTHVLRSCPKLEKIVVNDYPNPKIKRGPSPDVPWPASMQAVTLPEWHISKDALKNLIQRCPKLLRIVFDSFSYNFEPVKLLEIQFPPTFERLTLTNETERKRFCQRMFFEHEKVMARKHAVCLTLAAQFMLGKGDMPRARALLDPAVQAMPSYKPAQELLAEANRG